MLRMMYQASLSDALMATLPARVESDCVSSSRSIGKALGHTSAGNRRRPGYGKTHCP